jgi:hypothetical protein
MAKDLGLFTTTVVGGIGVLIGYFYLFLSKYLKPLAKKFTNKEWKIWSFSVILTIVSFLAIIVWFSFYQELDDWQRDLFYSSLIIFLTGAMIWSLSIFYIKKFKKHVFLQLPALMLTSLGTLGMLISVVYSTSNWLLITAASIVLFHHLIFDNIYWVAIDSR